MSKVYTDSFRVHALEKAFNRHPKTTLKEISSDLGISVSALRRWMKEAKEQSFNLSDTIDMTSNSVEKRPQDWSSYERFEFILQCEGLETSEISALCREQGLYPHHLKQWKDEFRHPKKSTDSPQKSELKSLKSENKSLKKELHRKEKALAETAALLVLKKKVHALLGENEAL